MYGCKFDEFQAVLSMREGMLQGETFKDWLQNNAKYGFTASKFISLWQKATEGTDEKVWKEYLAKTAERFIKQFVAEMNCLETKAGMDPKQLNETISSVLAASWG